MVYVMYSTRFTNEDKSLEYWFGFLNIKKNTENMQLDEMR